MHSSDDAQEYVLRTDLDEITMIFVVELRCEQTCFPVSAY